MKTVEIKRKIIRQWQCILQIDKLEIRVRHHRRRIAMFVEIQDISQNNVIKGAQQHVPYARKEVTWQKLVEVLGKQKNLKEKNHLQSHLIPIVS